MYSKQGVFKERERAYCTNLKNKLSLNFDVSRILIPEISEYLNALHASGNFWCLLITYANSLDPDQDRQNVGPDLNPNSLTV